MCRLSYPYRVGPSGWGVPTTKQEQFCELHYYITPYVAEFVNTISNLAYVFLGVYGITKMNRSQYHTAIWWSYISLASVGVGSTAFHATVTYTGQLADEISMLYATATIAYAVFSIELSSKQRPALAVLLSVIVVIITTIHIYMGESTVFQISWALMVIAIFAQCRRRSHVHIPAGQGTDETSRLVQWGTISFLAGFLLWNIDNMICSRLLALRSIIGMPLGFVTELHGWWHILTALGVYYYIVFIHYWRIQALSVFKLSQSSDTTGMSRQNSRCHLVWPHHSILPYVAMQDVKQKI